GATRDRRVLASADRRDPLALDDDHRVVDRRAARRVDQAAGRDDKLPGHVSPPLVMHMLTAAASPLSQELAAHRDGLASRPSSNSAPLIPNDREQWRLPRWAYGCARTIPRQNARPSQGG